ncbi:hypothetical protein DW050_04700 [Ruminococcus sp. AF42-10]|nr:hypothetical protein [Ruminococcus sp. AF42-10]RGF41373.1 hypothetical protein DW050_04700 [Ruminococcus sp. AF42-10]
MRKHSKFITILLSALLAVCLVQTVFVQAFATENSATPDEPTDGLYPVSMEVVKAPESVTVNKGRITDSTFWSNVVLHIVYSNGEEYDVNCDGIDSEGGIVPPIAEINGYAGKLTWMYNDGYEDNNAIGFIINYDYVNLFGENVFVSTEFSVKQVADPHSIARVEVTKLPDKVFTAPLWTGEPDYLPGEYYKWLDSLDINNSISHNCEGMEVTLYYANGEKCGTFVIADFKKNHIFNYLVNYILENFDEYGNALDMQVYDLGDYKFSVCLGSSDTEMIYTAKSVDNPNPSLNPVSTEDTPAKPAKPSGNISSATSDVATNDNANTNNSTNGTANNGVVATGNFATPAIITVVMLSAVAVMFVFKRKRMFYFV